MSTFRIIGSVFFGVLLLVQNVAAGGISTEGVVTPFVLEDVSGKVESSGLFVGRRVALVVLVMLGQSCPELEPFLEWRKRLSPEKVDRALMLCVGGRVGTDTSVLVAPHEAIKALGITGSPMLLGIEENHVKWRIAGLIPKWQVLAETWLRPSQETDGEDTE